MGSKKFRKSNSKKYKKKFREEKKCGKKSFKGNQRKETKSHYSLTNKKKVTNLSLQNEPKFTSYTEIKNYLNNLANKYKSNLQLQIIGESKEQRPIYLIVISQNDSEFPKNGIFIEAGSNGKDSMAIATALYMIKYLAQTCSCKTDSGIMDYFIIPCSNPDAYEMSKNGNHPYLDLSTNFPLRLGNSNIDNIRLDKFLDAAKIWKNKYDFQCPERLAVIKAITTYQFVIKLFVSLQEEGKKILYPFGASEDPVSNINSIREVALAGNFICYPIGSIYQLCGLKFGTIIDFLMMFQNCIKYPYIININNRECKSDLNDIPDRAREILCGIQLMSSKISEFYKVEKVKRDESNVTIDIKKEEP
ncbi:carboxypeptidase A4-like [Diorhabda carinulata]|uniref:carboxypeptidase A4-like n=1 Tax=Diorhabda carinulata TaxID=1163345 RepID=UPI0025A2A7A8|nr:carboxypeptidase A4-like [Diorhabda carinulata]